MTGTPALMSEDDLLTAVVDYARLRGILVHHSRPARVKGRDGKDRWVTAITGDAGLPDLVLVGSKGVLFRELKSQKGRLRPEQQTWIARLHAAGSDAAVWKPSDWPTRIRTEMEKIR